MSTAASCSTASAILRLHLDRALGGADLTAVVRRTTDWTGADLERIVREARRRARAARRPMEIADLEASLPELRAMSPEDRWRAAVHEAGHAVAGVVLGHVEILGARLEPQVPVSDPSRRALAGDRTASSWASGGAVSVRPSDSRLRTDADWSADLVLWLAGMAAEEEFLQSRSAGSTGGPGTDLHRATLLATRMEAHLGVGAAPIYLVEDRDQDLLKLLADDAQIRRRVERRLAASHATAKAMVAENGLAVLAVAALLFEEGRVSGERIREAVERRRGRAVVGRGTTMASAP